MRTGKHGSTLAEVRREALRVGQYARSGNLSGFGMTADHALEATGLFSKVRYKKTGDPRRAIVISCYPHRPRLSASEVRRSLEEVWEQDLDYGGQPSSYEIRSEPGKILLEFVTSSEDHELVVSGAIEVIGIEG
jgi:hypothetical protein